MPSSHPENKMWIMKKIKEINPKNILDVGAGEATYLEFIKSFISEDIKMDGIEVWEPYVDYFKLREKYDNLFMVDARNHDNFDYDIVIFGDILEHMSEEDSLKLWEKCSKQARYGIISIPIVHMPQGAYNDNPYEIHVEEDWDTKKVLEKFHSIVDHKEFDVTGSFVAKFNNDN